MSTRGNERHHAAALDRARWAALVAGVTLLVGLLALPAAASSGPTRLRDPLVEPRSAVPGSPITLAVTYRNREGSAPDWVRVAVGDAVHELAPLGDPQDAADWKAGVRFEAVVPAPAVGTYPVVFSAFDSRRFYDRLEAGFLTVVAPSPTPSATPAPTKTPTPTATPAPTKTPTPTKTPLGGSNTSGPSSSSGGTGADDGSGSSGGASPGSSGGSAGGGSGGASSGSSGSGGSAPLDPSPAPGGTSGGTSGSSAPAGPGGTTGGTASGGTTGTDPGSAIGGAPGDSRTVDPSTAVGGSDAPGPAGGGTEPGAESGASRGPGVAGAAGRAASVGAPGRALLDALGAGHRIPDEVWVASVFVTTAGGTAMAMAFLLFGRRRREDDAPPDGQQPATSPVGMPPTSVLVPGADVPENERHLPRWRRPSLLEARKTDPLRTERPTVNLTFASGAVRPLEGCERRRIRYRLVRLLDAPDEVRAGEIGILDEGDEVQLLERSGPYWFVLSPDGRRGWLHRMVLGEVVEDGAGRSYPGSDPDGGEFGGVGTGSGRSLLDEILARRPPADTDPGH